MVNNVETCPDCGAEIKIPEDAVIGEIVSCPDCALDFEIVEIEGKIGLRMLTIEAEDWGE